MKKIMFVDGEIEATETAARLLEKEGYEICVSNSGKDASDSVTKFKPDLILLDIMMPDMDGFVVCEAIKSSNKTCNIPVIFVTRLWENQEIFERIIESGGNGYLTELGRGQKLFKTLDYYLDKKPTTSVFSTERNDCGGKSENID